MGIYGGRGQMLLLGKVKYVYSTVFPPRPVAQEKQSHNAVKQ